MAVAGQENLIFLDFFKKWCLLVDAPQCAFSSGVFHNETSMEPLPEQVEDLLEQLRNGRAEAEGQLFQMLLPWIRKLIRRQLDDRVRRWMDSDDVFQNLAVAFLDVAGKKRGFKDGQECLKYLARAARNMTISANRAYLTVHKRQADALRAFLGEDEDDELVSPQSGPFEQAEVNDSWDTLLANVTEPARTILLMRRAGHSTEEIAARIGTDERTVRRILEPLRKLLTS
jgi:RNA polymerase sigma factor (sigma-70 family)